MVGATMAGRLYIVATPIGNMGDMTLRAIETLKMVDMVAAEDTRRAGLLLKHFGLSKPLISCFDSNERARVTQIRGELQAGKSIALISDAGSPLINDPGYVITAACYDAKIAVEVVPGACAVIAALSLSGLPAYPFRFIGFFPRQGGKKRQLLADIGVALDTTVMFESPRRVSKTITSLIDVTKDRHIAILREITKTYQERLVGTAAELSEQLATRDIKGEIVIVIAGNEDKKPDALPDDAVFLNALSEGKTARDIADKMKAAGYSRSKAYKHALSLVKDVE